MAQYAVQYPSPARRLHVVWRKGQWSVEGEVRIPSMTLLRSDDLPPSEHGVSGFWWEAVDDKSQVIYRHRLPDPFAGMETFEREGRITRVHGKMHDEVTFDVLIPDLPRIAGLHFYSSSKPGMLERESKGPAGKIAELDIRKREGGDHGRK